nr:MAG TPA: hypothetical protein [Caudoviricetes sp.]
MCIIRKKAYCIYFMIPCNDYSNIYYCYIGY